MSGKMDSRPEGRAIRLRMETSASPERAWEAWTDPKKIAQWFVDRARGEPVAGTTYTWIFEKFNYEIPFRVVEAEPGRRLSLGGEAPDGRPFLLEIEISREAGRTVVTLANSGLREGTQWDDEYDGIASGWAKSLAILKLYLERHYGEDKTTVLALRPAVFSFQALLPYFASAQGLNRWLASSSAMGQAGEGYSISFADGGHATGRVLLVTGREVVASWDEIDGVLEFMAVSMGSRRMAGLRAVSWGLKPERAREIEILFDAALGRLAAALPARANGASAPSSASPAP